MPKQFQVALGQQFGEYTVVNCIGEKGNGGYTYFDCVCSCGKQEYVRLSRLFREGYKACKSCHARRNYNLYTKDKWDAVRSNAIGDLSGTFFSHIKQAAKTRKKEFSITMEQLWELFVAQDNKCAMTGLDIQLSLDRKKSDPDFSKITASLDRIDSSKGYTVDNIQWVHKDINRMKWSLSKDDFIYLCNLVSNKHGNTEPSSGNFKSTEKVQRIEVEAEEADNTSTKNDHPTS